MRNWKHRNRPPICTAMRLLVVMWYTFHLYRQCFWESTRAPWVGSSRKFLTKVNEQGTKNQPEDLLRRVFFWEPLGSWTFPPSGQGRPCRKLYFHALREMGRESLWPRMSARISALASAGYPAQELSLWAAFWFLNEEQELLQQSLRPRLAVPTSQNADEERCHKARPSRYNEWRDKEVIDKSYAFQWERSKERGSVGGEGIGKDQERERERERERETDRALHIQIHVEIERRGGERKSTRGERQRKRERERDKYIYIYICCKVSNWATFGPF